jgi:hypothetical protein
MIRKVLPSLPIDLTAEGLPTVMIDLIEADQPIIDSPKLINDRVGSDPLREPPLKPERLSSDE